MADGESPSASEHILTVGQAVSQNSPNSLKSTCWSYWVVTLHVVAQEQWAHKGVSFPLSAGLVRGAILEPLCLHSRCCKTPRGAPHTLWNSASWWKAIRGKLLDFKYKSVNVFIAACARATFMHDCTRVPSLTSNTSFFLIWCCACALYIQDYSRTNVCAHPLLTWILHAHKDNRWMVGRMRNKFASWEKTAFIEPLTSFVGSNDFCITLSQTLIRHFQIMEVPMKKLFPIMRLQRSEQHLKGKTCKQDR